jgi:hypothetical protein
MGGACNSLADAGLLKAPRVALENKSGAGEAGLPKAPGMALARNSPGCNGASRHHAQKSSPPAQKRSTLTLSLCLWADIFVPIGQYLFADQAWPDR